MDALTAGFALAIVQLCIALVMIGAYFAAPPEKCTGYWAWAAIAIVGGVLVIVVNDGAPRAVVQLAGNSCLVVGAILQLWGTQAFYKAPGDNLGWITGAGFCLIFSLLILTGAPTAYRVVLLSATLLIVLMLTWRVLLAGMHPRRTFGGVLALGALAVLMLNNIVRIAAAVDRNADFLAMTQSATGIAILYLVPLGGIVLYATGLMLLYFERLVAHQNHLAMHDELTGMLNRRAIVAAGEHEVAVAIRNRQPLTVAFVDIDFFKRINDKLGHAAGDLVLADIARVLKGTCRTVDQIGRYGGEEFCIVFPRADQEGAAILGERLLAAVRQYRFHDRHPVTVSAGFASLPQADGERSWKSLIQRADIALYEAKAMGRDQCCIAAPAPVLAGHEAERQPVPVHV